MSKSSLTPNVALRCDIPTSTNKSFVRGNVYCTLSDIVFLQSCSFHHRVMLRKIVKELELVLPILIKYKNGGTDQRNTLESVKVASIYLVKKLDLDLMIAARCVPGLSYVNPAERISSILNLGLQNVATERDPCDD